MPAANKLPGMRGEAGAVGGERQLVERAADLAAQAVRQIDHVAADQRLAAGQSDLAHAACDEALGDQRDLLEAEQFRPRQEGHLLRHAIAAAEIAAIGDRDRANS